MKSFIKPLPLNTQVQGSGSPAADMNKVVDALSELRSSIPNTASEVNAAPNTILNSSGKVLDTALASAFVKTINGISADSGGNVVVTVNGGYDGSDAVKTSGTQTISGVKSFTSAPTIATDAVNANEAVRKSQLDFKANASATVNLSGDQNLTGVKSFGTPPVSANAATTSNQLVRKNELDLKADSSALSSKADDTAVVKLTGAQTVLGVKTFTSAPVSSSTASVDSQLINFGQVKGLIPGLGSPSTLLASQDFSGTTNGQAGDYDINIIPNGNATGASVTAQNGAMRFTAPASGEVNRKFWYSDSPVADADISLSFTWDGSGAPSAWFIFRSDNTSTTANRTSGSMIHVNFAANELNFGRSSGGTYTPYAAYGGPKAQTWTANTKYRIRALLVGQRIRYKVWQASVTEPSNWTLDISDPTAFNGAVASVGTQIASSTAVASNVFIDDLSWFTVATGTVYAQTVNGIAPDVNGNVTVSAGMTARTLTAGATLVASDANTAVDYNSSSAGNITVPSDSTTLFAVGTVIEFSQLGTGQVTLVPASGVTLRSAGTLKTRVQYSVIAMRKLSSNTWLVSGDLG